MTKQERINEWEKKIEQIVSNYKNLSKRCDAADEAGTLTTEGNLFRAIWSAFESMLNMVDQHDWISWYLFENDCGARKMEAGYDDEISKITTPRQLAKLIVEGEERYNVSIEQQNIDITTPNNK
jgi:hypothetical protein